MRLLNSGGGNGPQRVINSTNTGTGGSTSDGSSGHASMSSDSQTSGSPPAEYVTSSSISATTGNLVPSTNNNNNNATPSPGGLNTSGYKSVLKSVPEDETNSITASVNSGINSTTNTIVSSPGRSLLPVIGSSENKAGNSDRKSLDSSFGSKKSSRSSRHRNKVCIIYTKPHEDKMHACSSFIVGN